MRALAFLLLALVAGCGRPKQDTQAAVDTAVQTATEAVAGAIEQPEDVQEAAAPAATAVVLAAREVVEQITPEPLPPPVPAGRQELDPAEAAIQEAASDPGARVITKYETVSPAYYEKALKAIYCPDGKTVSGPTGGVGYDFAHQTPAEIRKVWGWHPQIEAMVAASGQAGPAKCKAWREKYGRILIDLDDARRVFALDSFPKYRRMATRALPGLKGKTRGHIGGVTSTGYRRGWAMVGARNRHKVVIRDRCMPIEDQRESAECSAQQTIAMCVIWEGTDTYKGQCRRSHDEAAIIRLDQP